MVECKPKNELEWRHRLQKKEEDGCCGSWHEPTTWRDMEKLSKAYTHRIDHDVGKVTIAMIGRVVEFVGTSHGVSWCFYSFTCHSKLIKPYILTTYVNTDKKANLLDYVSHHKIQGP